MCGCVNVWMCECLDVWMCVRETNMLKMVNQLNKTLVTCFMSLACTVFMCSYPFDHRRLTAEQEGQQSSGLSLRPQWSALRSGSWTHVYNEWINGEMEDEMNGWMMNG